MAWMAVGGAVAGAVVPGLLGGGGEGGQTQTQSKDPWAAAIPWLTQNLQSGQALQAQYAANPFSAQQQQSYGNQFANSDYMRQLTGSVLGQMNQQKPFDRTNPSARPQGFQLPQMLQRSPTNSNLFTAPVAAPAPVAAAPAPAQHVYTDRTGDGADNIAYQMWQRSLQNQMENAGPGNGSY